MKIPTELIPDCSVCGKPMSMNLRADNTFVQDNGWYQASERYSDFIRRHRGHRVVFFELGVGMNTPVFCSSSTRGKSRKNMVKQQVSSFLTREYEERRCA